VDAKANSAAVAATGELYLWGMGVYGNYKTPFRVASISNPVADVRLGTSNLGSAIDTKGLLWTWGSNIAGELGLGDNEPKVTPYPVMALKNKKVTQVACGSSFVVALGSNLKKELPGLKLNMKKVTNIQRRHRRNTEGINISAGKKSNGSLS
jgi:X-linked retinitis pigmentosa GTPase regulator